MAPQENTIEERAFAYFLMHEMRELLMKNLPMRRGYILEFTKTRWEMWEVMPAHEKKKWIDMVLEEMEEESPRQRRTRPSFLEPH
jgi:hypothetical protein